MFLYLKKLQEKWSLKTPEIQKVNNSGISLCNLISAVTTPAKAIAAVKSGMCFVYIHGRSPKELGLPMLCPSPLVFKLMCKITSEIQREGVTRKLASIHGLKVCSTDGRVSVLVKFQIPFMVHFLRDYS